MLTCHAVIKTNLNDFPFGLTPTFSQRLFEILLERGDFSGVKVIQWQTFLIRPEILPIDIKISLAIQLVLLPSNLQKLVHTKWVSRSEDDAVDIGSLLDGERSQVIALAFREQTSIVRKGGAMDMIVVIRTDNLLPDRWIISKAVKS